MAPQVLIFTAVLIFGLCMHAVIAIFSIFAPFCTNFCFFCTYFVCKFFRLKVLPVLFCKLFHLCPTVHWTQGEKNPYLTYSIFDQVSSEISLPISAGLAVSELLTSRNLSTTWDRRGSCDRIQEVRTTAGVCRIWGPPQGFVGGRSLSVKTTRRTFW